jgi:diguanylate cyclase (GGDEF)-like protein
MMILAVDDNVDNLQLIGEALQKEGHETAFALSGEKALEFARNAKPDLILLDVMMPEFNGYEVAGILKKGADTRDIPIIFLTAKAATEDVVKGFEAGAVDYVLKPFNILELVSRVRTHLELKKSREELAQYAARLEKSNDELRQALERLDLAAKTDFLTGLVNRRYISDRVADEIKRAKRSGRPFSLIIADIDGFKSINDEYGHDCGDVILKSVTADMKSGIRAQDQLARWGGEEFLFLLPETSVEGAATLAEKIRSTVAGRTYSYGRGDFAVTITMGVAEYGGEDEMDPTLIRADRALYQGKRQGKNRVVSDGPAKPAA